MTDDDERTLHPATVGELEASLSFALRYEGRKRVHTADDVNGARDRRAPDPAPAAVLDFAHVTALRG